MVLTSDRPATMMAAQPKVTPGTRASIEMRKALTSDVKAPLAASSRSGLAPKMSFGSMAMATNSSPMRAPSAARLAAKKVRNRSGTIATDPGQGDRGGVGQLRLARGLHDLDPEAAIRLGRAVQPGRVAVAQVHGPDAASHRHRVTIVLRPSRLDLPQGVVSAIAGHMEQLHR